MAFTPGPTSPQLTYNRQFGNPYAGQLGYAMPSDFIKTYLNKALSGGQTGTAITLSAGLGLVAQAANSDPAHEVTLPSASSQPCVGIGVLDMSTDPNFIAGTANARYGESMSVLAEGAIWVVTEAVVAVGANPYLRYATGTGLIVGAFYSGTDTSTCRLVAGCRVLEAATSASPSAPATMLVYFSASQDYSSVESE